MKTQLMRRAGILFLLIGVAAVFGTLSHNTIMSQDMPLLPLPPAPETNQEAPSSIDGFRGVFPPGEHQPFTSSNARLNVTPEQEQTQSITLSCEGTIYDWCFKLDLTKPGHGLTGGPYTDGVGFHGPATANSAGSGDRRYNGAAYLLWNGVFNVRHISMLYDYEPGENNSGMGANGIHLYSSNDGTGLFTTFNSPGTNVISTWTGSRSFYGGIRMPYQHAWYVPRIACYYNCRQPNPIGLLRIKELVVAGFNPSPPIVVQVLVCTAQVIDPINPPDQSVTLRDRPTINGTKLYQLEAGTLVNAIDGWEEYGWWWWHVSIASDPSKTGYLREDVVKDLNNCPRISVEPPAPPQPQPGEMCTVKLLSEPAVIYDGRPWDQSPHPIIDENGHQMVIVDTTLGVHVHGQDYNEAYYLISQPGILPQQWVLQSKFNNFNQRACQPVALGRFKWTIDPLYWNAVGVYANTFRAPISATQFTSEYAIFRNSQVYTRGGHTGVDLVYRPPDGGDNRTSSTFPVHAQSNGIVVDAGPDGISRTYRLKRVSCSPEPTIGNIILASNPKMPPGVDYWQQGFSGQECGTMPNPLDPTGPEIPRPGVREIYDIAQRADFDDDPDNDVSEEPVTGYYPFGLSFGDMETITNLGFAHQCSGNGCTNGPGRRLIIWYDTANDDIGGTNRPEIQTVYYHVGVDELPQYQAWNQICSTTNRSEIWHRAMVENEPIYDVCSVASEDFLGPTLLIGFTTGIHLHYEVQIDANNDGQFDPPIPTDREDPIIAFWTVR